MCGIMAAFNLNGINYINQKTLMNSIESVEHRGPDNISFHRDENCFLGHARLSIIDTEKSANQPYAYEDLLLTYNGEIFNYIELKDELIGLGYKFSTVSDTEVIIKAFHCWGAKCLNKFNGMWAFVIYNKKNKTIFVSRDRFGQKPLFVSFVGGTYFFSSEAHQLLDYTDHKPNFNTIQKFLKEGGFESEGQTFFSDIEEFPKAHYFVISKKNIKSYRYWSYPTGKSKKTTVKCFQDFEDLLEDAVRIRLRSDVPVGLLLSGGVDSSIIASIVKDLLKNNNKLQTFTYSSGDKFDETKYAKSVVKKLDFELNIRTQDNTAKNYINRLENLVKKMGRGHSSPSIVSIDYLYQSASEKNIKVLLDGQGADELLAGYKPVFFELLATQLFQRKFLQVFYNIRNFLSPKDSSGNNVIEEIILFFRNILPFWARSIMRRIYGYEKLFSNVKHKEKKSRIVHEVAMHKRNPNALNRLLQKQHSNGLENLLFYGDIIAMNNSIENRSPFMDHRLVEFCFKYDEILKIYNKKEKAALKFSSHYLKFVKVLDRNKIGFDSNIKFETKNKMIRILRKSSILSWPIFSRSFSKFLSGDLPISEKYERLLFRAFQVHLWQKNFTEIKKRI
jgi:asparagine synthase (glutamine-hydrolysing)